MLLLAGAFEGACRMSERQLDGPEIARGRAAQARLTRRQIVGGVALVVAAMPGQSRAEGAELAADDRLVFIDGPEKDSLLKPDLLEVGVRPRTVFPIAGGDGAPKDASRLNRILAVRLDETEMDAETRAASAGGVLLYSALCTHQACTIAAWKPKERHLRCHCHLSEFAALQMGAVRKGPARVPLALAPARIDPEGYVRLAGGFNRAPGPHG
jgi:nitrite reductase/ring-hydroxylating ferredoxin subunit